MTMGAKQRRIEALESELAAWKVRAEIAEQGMNQRESALAAEQAAHAETRRLLEHQAKLTNNAERGVFQQAETIARLTEALDGERLSIVAFFEASARTLYKLKRDDEAHAQTHAARFVRNIPAPAALATQPAEPPREPEADAIYQAVWETRKSSPMYPEFDPSEPACVCGHIDREHNQHGCFHGMCTCVDSVPGIRYRTAQERLSGAVITDPSAATRDAERGD